MTTLPKLLRKQRKRPINYACFFALADTIGAFYLPLGTLKFSGDRLQKPPMGIEPITYRLRSDCSAD